MSAISIETKKVTELTAFTTPTDSCLIPIHDGTGLKKITFANFRAKAVEGTEAKIAPLLFNNAGAHNAIYRGKSLGSTVTTAQYAAIKAGTFDDLYIGDYWTIGGVNYRIAAFDYYLNSGDTSCTTHHVVIVPDTCLYNAAMNSTNTTTGGYVGSAMYTANLEQAKTTIKGAFSGHVLKHRIYLTTGLDMNGTNYVSKEKVDETIFKDNLSTMKVSDGETETTYTDMVFVQQMEWADGTFYLAFREKTKEEKLVDALNANSNSITDVQVALAEVYEMVLGGN